MPTSQTAQMIGQSAFLDPNQPGKQEGVIGSRKEFRTGLLALVRFCPSNSRVPSRRYGALSFYPRQPAANDDPTCGYETAMIQAGVLHDTSELKLDAKSILRFMDRRITIHVRFKEIITDAIGLSDLDDLSERLAEQAAHRPELVKLALGGKLESAARAIPHIGKLKQNGSHFTREDGERLIALLADVSYWQLLAGLCDRARAAHRRLYEPTGIQALDRQEGDRATTVVTVAKGLDYNNGLVAEVLGFYRKSKIEPLTADEEATIASFPGLILHGERVMAKLAAEYGDDLPFVVEAWQRVVRDGNRYMRRKLAAFLRKHGNLTLTRHNGEEPLVLLFLACLQVSAWQAETVTKADLAEWKKRHGRKWIKTADEEIPARSNIHRALTNIWEGRPARPVAMPTRANPVARRLFFLVRNLITNDPRAVGFAGRDEGIGLDAIEEAYSLQNARWGAENTKFFRGYCSNEAFRTDSIDGFKEFYIDARKGRNRPILEEVRGPIWRQLHL